jgi:uncharacterized protein (DUF302 family)
MRAISLGLIAAVLLAGAAAAQSIPKRAGWRVLTSGKDYPTLLADLGAAVVAADMRVVTESGPTEAAARRGEIIPGVRVVGVFRNDFAVTVVRAAPAAMIESPVRFLVTEERGGHATLSYKLPSFVFAPYAAQGGGALTDAAVELDTIFAAIAEAAVAPAIRRVDN